VPKPSEKGAAQGRSYEFLRGAMTPKCWHLREATRGLSNKATRQENHASEWRRCRRYTAGAELYPSGSNPCLSNSVGSYHRISRRKRSYGLFSLSNPDKSWCNPSGRTWGYLWPCHIPCRHSPFLQGRFRQGIYPSHTLLGEYYIICIVSANSASGYPSKFK